MLLHLLLTSIQADTPHRHLPSFPTRRSSDLQTSVYEIYQMASILLFAVTAKKPMADKVVSPLTFTTNILGRPAMLSRYLERSEEHTFELQSRGHLVCRLLLEKKKQTKMRVEQ